jgi:hypothetical protein
MLRSSSFRQMFSRLLWPQGRGRPAKTVEVFGWLILVEGATILFAPHFVASVLHIPAFTVQGANYFRLVGMLTGGLGMLYVVSGRLKSEEFVFATLLDRPLVPLVMVVLWYSGIILGPLALAFSLQDFAGFIWTLASLWGEQGDEKAPSE